MDIGNENTTKAMNIALNHINNHLLKNHHSNCTEWTQPKALLVESFNGLDKGKHFTNIKIVFVVQPIQAEFEAVVQRINDKYSILGKILRNTLFGKTSWCMESREMKDYCYCKDQK